MNARYAQASAYGEMMERLQNGALFPMRQRRYALEKGALLYHYAPDERYLSSREAARECGDVVEAMFHLPKGEAEAFLARTSETDQVPCVPFYSVMDGRIRLLPAELIWRVTGTNGMCAGQYAPGGDIAGPVGNRRAPCDMPAVFGKHAAAGDSGIGICRHRGAQAAGGGAEEWTGFRDQRLFHGPGTSGNRPAPYAAGRYVCVPSGRRSIAGYRAGTLPDRDVPGNPGDIDRRYTRRPSAQNRPRPRRRRKRQRIGATSYSLSPADLAHGRNASVKRARRLKGSATRGRSRTRPIWTIWCGFGGDGRVAVHSRQFLSRFPAYQVFIPGMSEVDFIFDAPEYSELLAWTCFAREHRTLLTLPSVTSADRKRLADAICRLKDVLLTDRLNPGIGSFPLIAFRRARKTVSCLKRLCTPVRSAGWMPSAR